MFCVCALLNTVWLLRQRHTPSRIELLSIQTIVHHSASVAFEPSCLAELGVGTHCCLNLAGTQPYVVIHSRVEVCFVKFDSCQ